MLLQNDINKIYIEYKNTVNKFKELSDLRKIFQETQNTILRLWDLIPRDLSRVKKSNLEILIDRIVKLQNLSYEYSLNIFEKKFPLDIKKNFNKIVDFLRKVGIVDINKIYKNQIINSKDYEIIRESFINSTIQKLEYVKSNIAQKISFIKEYLDIDFSDDNLNIKKTFKPKITLPQKLAVGIKDDKIIAKYEGLFYDFKNYITKASSKVISGEITNNELTKDVMARLEKFYPTGKVPYYYTDKYGRMQIRNLNLNWYGELWTNYIRQTSANYSTLANAKLSGQDLVRVENYYYGCSLCQNHIGNIYSISGKTPGYPILEWSPPYHPFCHCILIVWIIFDKNGGVVQTGKKWTLNKLLNTKNIINPMTADINKMRKNL